MPITAPILTREDLGLAHDIANLRAYFALVPECPAHPDRAAEHTAAARKVLRLSVEAAARHGSVAALLSAAGMPL